MQVYNQPEGEEERGYKEIKYEQQVHKFKTLLWLVMTTKWVGLVLPFGVIHVIFSLL